MRHFSRQKAAKVEAVIQSWDTAYQGDECNAYSVCTTWVKCPDGYYLLDVWRDRPNFADLVKQVYALKPWLIWLGPEKGKDRARAAADSEVRTGPHLATHPGALAGAV